MSWPNISDSNGPDHLDAKHERNREQHIEGIKRWVEYISSEPPETWGLQQNAVVETSATHHKHVKAVAEDILEQNDSDNGSS